MKSEYNWRTGRYCVYKNFLHVIFITKYRRNVLTKEMLTCLKQVIKETCLELKGELLQFGGEDDHVHLMVSVPPTKALCHFIGRLKGKSSFVLRKKFEQEIKNKLWGNHFWSPSYCAVSCGGASLEVIKKYIENQRQPISKRSIKQSLQEKGRVGEKSRVSLGRKSSKSLTPS